jgi:hypothetical protein
MRANEGKMYLQGFQDGLKTAPLMEARTDWKAVVDALDGLLNKESIRTLVVKNLLVDAAVTALSSKGTPIDLSFDDIGVVGGKRSQRASSVLRQLESRGVDRQWVLFLCKLIAKRANPQGLLPFEPDVEAMRKAARAIQNAMSISVLRFDDQANDDQANRETLEFLRHYVAVLPRMLELYARILEEAIALYRQTQRPRAGHDLLVLMLGDYVRKHAGQPHWSLWAVLIQSFGGNDTQDTLTQKYKRSAAWLKTRTTTATKKP